MIPVTRIDMYLATISGDEDAVTPLPDPITRIDHYLANLAGMEVAELPEPVTRIDYYLAALCGMNVVLPDEPITRIDFYLAALNGETVETPEAVTRIDYYLDAWAQGGGGLPWTTFTGNPLQFNAPKAHTLRSTTVEFSPIQSGTGDPSPDNVRPISGWDSVSVWGAGENLAPRQTGYNSQGGTIESTYISTTSDTAIISSLIPVTPNTAYVIKREKSGGMFRWFFFDREPVLNVTTAIGGYYSNQSNTESAITTPANAKYMFVLWTRDQDCGNVQVNLGSTASPYTPYTGRSVSVTFPATGTNQWDEEWANGYFNTTTGAFTESASNTTLCSKNYIPVKGGTTYCFVQPINQSPQVYQYDKSEGFLGRITGILANNGTFTVDANCAFIKFAVFGYGSGHYDKDVSINYPSTETGYHPYLTTVYGGHLRINMDGSVDLVGEDYLAQIKNFDWAYSAQLNIFYANPSVSGMPMSKVSAKIISDAYKPASSYQSDKGVFPIYSDRVGLHDSGYNTKESLVSAMGDYHICYELATPVTYHLDSIPPITAVQGINTMWTDGDSLTVEARGEAVDLNALQSLNLLLGGRYVNNHTANDLTDEEALDIILNGGNR